MTALHTRRTSTYTLSTMELSIDALVSMANRAGVVVTDSHTLDGKASLSFRAPSDAAAWSTVYTLTQGRPDFDLCLHTGLAIHRRIVAREE